MPRGRPKRSEISCKSGDSRKAITPEGRENQLIALAVDCAEQQLRDGTASAQVITHYLKLGTAREKLEREKIALENELIKAKRKAIEASEKSDRVYAEAIKAMGIYSGNFSETDDLDDEPDDYYD